MSQLAAQQTLPRQIPERQSPAEVQATPAAPELELEVLEPEPPVELPLEVPEPPVELPPEVPVALVEVPLEGPEPPVELPLSVEPLLELKATVLLVDPLELPPVFPLLPILPTVDVDPPPELEPELELFEVPFPSELPPALVELLLVAVCCPQPRKSRPPRARAVQGMTD